MATETLVPTAIEATSGLSGSVGDVDNTIAGTDNVWLTAPDDGVDVQVRCEFATPTANPTIGADLQTFRIRCRRSATGGNDPTLDVHLYENNVLNTTLQTGITITSDAGQLVEVTWNANLLNTADGSNVELHLYGNRSGGSPTSRRTVEFDEMEWLVDYNPPITPGTATITLTNFAPTINISAPVTVVPGLAQITLTNFAPTILTPRIVQPGLAQIALTNFAPTVVVPVWRSQAGFRGREDNGNETTATWIQPLNTNWTQATASNFRVRFLIQALGTGSANDQTFQLTAQHNTGSWFDVTGSSSVIKVVASPNVTDGGNTTQQLGSGTFITPNAGIDEVDGQVGGTDIDFAGLDEVEVEFVLQIVDADVSASDTIKLRLNVL